MKVNGLSPRRVDAHRFVAIRRQKEMTVIGRYNAVLDAGCSELSNGAREVVDHRVHHLPRLERKPRLAGVIDFLRADDDHLRAVDLLRELRRLEAQ